LRVCRLFDKLNNGSMVLFNLANVHFIVKGVFTEENYPQSNQRDNISLYM